MHHVSFFEMDDNAIFIENRNGHIIHGISIFCQIGHSVYSAPNLYQGKFYEAQKADIWSLGICLFKMSFGFYPYQQQNTELDQGFLAIRSYEIDQFMERNGLSEYSHPSMRLILKGLLCYDEERRDNALDILQSKWLQTYWNQYRERIIAKSMANLEKLKSDSYQKRMEHFPFYRIKL